MDSCFYSLSFFFFNDTATTEIYTLSLHDALPISPRPRGGLSARVSRRRGPAASGSSGPGRACPSRSEEHTSELQSQSNLVCRLLLEKKKNSRASARKSRYVARSCTVRNALRCHKT